MVDLSLPSFSEARKLELTAEGAVEPRFIDAMGHMNVAWYLHWFDRGVWAFFARHGLDEPALKQTQRGCFALEDHIRYVSELREGDALAVHTAVIEFRPKTLRLVQYLVAPSLEKLAATREVVAVQIDLATRRSTPFSEEVRRLMEASVLPTEGRQMDEVAAQSFARAWVAAWNARDVEAVLSHYAEDAVFVSPRATRLMGVARMEGKAALRTYWQTGNSRLSSLRFRFDQATWSPKDATLTVLYEASLGSEPPVRAAEIMRFRGAQIIYGEALYGAPVDAEKADGRGT